MATFDYVKTANTALRLIERFGRDGTFRQLTDQAADPNKPWRGAADPTAAPAASVPNIKFAAVPPSSANALGMNTTDNDLVKRSTQILIVAPGPTLPNNLAEFHEVIDGGITWRITGVETLRPADLTLLYFVGVAQ